MMRIVLEFGLRHPEGTRDFGLFTQHRRGGSLFRNPKSEIRNALTLIELMVVIVILMTLVGGVIPVLSPNNEARKIRDASRGLQTYIMQAQARAARTGRPTGIAFRETSPGSGVALDVFQIEIPPPFTGFSSASSARFYRNPSRDDYTIELGEGYLVFINDEGVGSVPPQFTKPGDLIEVGNGLFQLGYANARNELEEVNDVYYFKPTNLYKNAKLLPSGGPRTFPTSQGTAKTPPNRYRIARQPVNTSESPYTLPAGVAIDMHASGTEGGSTPTLFALHVALKKDGTIDPNSPPKQVGIMFSPSGGVDSVYYSNGKIFGPTSSGSSVPSPITDASRVFLLLGRVENVVQNMRSSPSAISEGATDEQLAELQQRINWLNLDSRWIAFDTRSGRSVVTDNTFVDARRYFDLWGQLNVARQFARQMRSGNGR